MATTKKTAKSTKATKPETSRGRTYSLTAAGKKADLGGQASIVKDALAKLETATAAEIAAAVEKTGKLETRQPVGRVVSFYLSQFRADGWVKQGAKPKAKPTAEEAAA